jgi:16S rRNA (guanine966-N2)-methyltransferase
MTRIIGGLIGSRKLASPAKSTRPTADRIRESIFSSLESKNALAGRNVLDLYAGTGALGLEALSRGSKKALLVESNRQAAAVCIQNARLVQDAMAIEEVEVLAQVKIAPVQAFLDSNTEIFNLVFIDPPYELENAELEKNLDSLRSSVSADALVLVERSSRAEAIASEKFELVDQKTFGDTAVYWLKPNLRLRSTCPW